MECQENGRTMWWKLGASLEVTTIKLKQDGENWNDSCLVLYTPLGRGVGRTCGVITFLSLLTLFVIYRIWFKGTPKKLLEEEGSIIFPFNFPFPLEAIFHLPLEPMFLQSLQKFPRKKVQYFPLRESPRRGCFLSNNWSTNHIGKVGNRPILE
jgi:hypothetical protein